jgi:two-component system, OmpR family, phosphate regulon response regulator PhoB
MVARAPWSATIKSVTSAKTILVVEDDPALRRLFTTALGQAGYEVLEAPNGYEAMHLVDRRRPDLIVLDLLLPGFGGLGVQKELGQRAISKDIPIVIVTGSIRNLEDVPVACVLRKPVDPDALVETVRKCLDEAK